MPANVPEDRLTDATVSLQTTDPSVDGAGLDAIGDAVADATVVGLGEATHGTREFFELKHRVVRHLVEERDLRLFAIEAAFDEMQAVDEYVRGERDADAADVLREHTRFWTWQTEAVRDFLEWARAFNDDRDPTDQLRFYGYDAQFVGGSIAALDDYLADAATDLREAFATPLAALEDGVGRDDDRAPDPDDVAMLESLADDLPSALDDYRDALVDATSAREWRTVRHHARILGQAAERFRATLAADGSMSAEAFAARDRAMAENIEWLLDHEPHDTVAVWAHDGHIMRGSIPMPNDEHAETMGSFLDDRFGADYYPLGFTFDRGAFRAYDGTAEEMERRVFEVAAVDGSLGNALAATGRDTAFLDVPAARDADLGDWVDDDHEKRAIGAVYDPNEPEEYRRPEPLAATFDGVLFVRETTASRGLGD